ncbi:MAG: hypothetical protein BGO07_01245 [Alphaproteobacteria bacterium 40-19]|nr:MAG: hypothetical protein BGO07_01245 [Alphaproteobacteria bacterium 40-19]
MKKALIFLFFVFGSTLCAANQAVTNPGEKSSDTEKIQILEDEISLYNSFIKKIYNEINKIQQKINQYLEQGYDVSDCFETTNILSQDLAELKKRKKKLKAN